MPKGGITLGVDTEGRYWLNYRAVCRAELDARVRTVELIVEAPAC